MPPADRFREQNEQDPGRVAHARQEAGSGDFLAVGPALWVIDKHPYWRTLHLLTPARTFPVHAQHLMTTASTFNENSD